MLFVCVEGVQPQVVLCVVGGMTQPEVVLRGVGECRKRSVRLWFVKVLDGARRFWDKGGWGGFKLLDIGCFSC